MKLDKENFSIQKKKLKRYHYEQQRLEMILEHVKHCNDYKDLCNNTISKLYGFEALKHELSGYYSFRLSKCGGMVKLLCSIDIEANTVQLEFISMNHYEDFKNKIK